jgi:hypothetical protein
MNTRRALHLLSISAVLITGCNSSSQPSDAQSGAHATSSHSFTTATITNPALNNMPAETISIPAGWKFQGIILKSPCTSSPSAVYRAYAPDGLTEMRSSPMIAWRWSADPHASKPAGCLPFSGPLSAADVLNKYVETIPGGVHVVGPMTLPAAAHKPLDDMAANMNQQAQQHAMAPPFGPPH